MRYRRLVGGFLLLAVSAFALQRVLFSSSRQLLVGSLRSAPASSCYQSLQKGNWYPLGNNSCSELLGLSSRVATCSQEDGAYWLWDQADRCGLHGFSREALRRLWRNSTIYLAGDSHVRYVYNAISRVFDGVQLRPGHVSHINHEQYFDSTGTLLKFLWAPYTDNTTLEMERWVESGKLPDLLVASNGFWHATRPRYKREHWVHNYAKAVAELAEASEALQRRAQRMRMVWLSVPPSKSFVQFKGQDVPDTRDQEYNEAARAALVRPHGPYHLVDLYELFQGCTQWCRFDRIHVNSAVNDLMVQLIANLQDVLLGGNLHRYNSSSGGTGGGSSSSSSNGGLDEQQPQPP